MAQAAQAAQVQAAGAFGCQGGQEWTSTTSKSRPVCRFYFTSYFMHFYANNIILYLLIIDNILFFASLGEN